VQSTPLARRARTVSVPSNCFSMLAMYWSMNQVKDLEPTRRNAVSPFEASLMSHLGQSGEEPNILRVQYHRPRMGSTLNQVAPATTRTLSTVAPSEILVVTFLRINNGVHINHRSRLSHSANLVPGHPPLSKPSSKARSAPKISLRFLHTQRPIPVRFNSPNSLGTWQRAFLAFREFPVPSLRPAKSRYRLPPQPQLNVALLHKLGGGCEIENNFLRRIRSDMTIKLLGQSVLISMAPRMNGSHWLKASRNKIGGTDI
jgi:hypothetical protein